MRGPLGADLIGSLPIRRPAAGSRGPALLPPNRQRHTRLATSSRGCCKEPCCSMNRGTLRQLRVLLTECSLCIARRTIPGRFAAEWRPRARWRCLTGDAQVAISWTLLHRRLGERSYRHAAERMAEDIRLTVRVAKAGRKSQAECRARRRHGVTMTRTDIRRTRSSSHWICSRSSGNEHRDAVGQSYYGPASRDPAGF